MIQDNIFNLIEILPTFGKINDGYYLGWKLPDFYQKHKKKIARCPQLQERIVLRCREVLDECPFDIDRVELKFFEHGPIIDVPGDACGIFPEGESYGCHNVDTPTQCLSLLVFGLVAMEETYKAMMLWEENPEADLEGEAQDRTYRLEKAMENKQFKPYKVISDEREFGDEIGIVMARTWQEAEETGKLLCGGVVARANPCFLTEPKAFPNLHIYEVRVRFEDGLDRTYGVLARKGFLAEEMVEEQIKRTPFLWPVKSIEVVSKSPIKPGVFSTD